MRRLLAIAVALLVVGGLGSFVSSSTTQAQTSSPGFDYPLGPPDGTGYAANGFGFLEHAYYGARCGWVFHPGEDWNDANHGDDSGDPIFAVADGVIVEARVPSGAGDGWGHLLLIRHDGDFALPEGGSISTVWSQYGHMSSIATNPRTGEPWKANDSVFRGEQIGSIGDYPYLSGNAFHLHFEIRKQKLHSASSFPCGKSEAYVTARYTEPSAFIDFNRPDGDNPILPIFDTITGNPDEFIVWGNSFASAVAQSFQLPDDATFLSSSVHLAVTSDHISDSLVVGVHADAGGAPDPTPIAQADPIPGSGLPVLPDSSVASTTFDSGLTLPAGKYWIVFTRTGAVNDAEEYAIEVRLEDPYSGGTAAQLRTQWEALPFDLGMSVSYR